MPQVGEPVIDPRTIRPDLNPDLAEFLVTACSSGNGDLFSTAAGMLAALRSIRTDL
jgi:hypothetical protein